MERALDAGESLSTHGADTHVVSPTSKHAAYQELPRVTFNSKHSVPAFMNTFPGVLAIEKDEKRAAVLLSRVWDAWGSLYSVEVVSGEADGLLLQSCSCMKSRETKRSNLSSRRRVYTRYLRLFRSSCRKRRRRRCVQTDQCYDPIRCRSRTRCSCHDVHA